MATMAFLFREGRQPRLMSAQETQAAMAALPPDRYSYSEWREGSSSWIAALRYNPVGNFGQMKVKKGGKIYTFGNMAFAAFYSWVNAGSWGQYFNRHLKGRYVQ